MNHAATSIGDLIGSVVPNVLTAAELFYIAVVIAMWGADVMYGWWHQPPPRPDGWYRRLCVKDRYCIDHRFFLGMTLLFVVAGLYAALAIVILYDPENVVPLGWSMYFHLSALSVTAAWALWPDGPSKEDEAEAA